MKKFLLSTSAIVGVGLIAAPAVAAEKIKLGFGGYYEEYIGFVDAEEEGTGASGRDIASFNLLNDAEIYFAGTTKLDNGISISVRVELEAMENQTTVDESYVTIASDTMGMLRLGGDDADDGPDAPDGRRRCGDCGVRVTPLRRRSAPAAAAAACDGVVQFLLGRVAGARAGGVQTRR